MQSVLRGLRVGPVLSARAGLACRTQGRVPCIAQQGQHSSAGRSGPASSLAPIVPALPRISFTKGGPLRRLLSVRVRGVGGGAAGGSVPPRTGGGGGGGGGGGASGSGGGLWAGYLRALESNPILTKAITSAVLNAVGDLLAQLVVEKSDRIDVKRLAVFTALGFLVIGPVLHFWYGLNARLVTTGGTKGALMRMGLDQLLFAPAFVALVFGSIFVLEGHPGDIKPKLKQDWRETVIANWKLWVPAQFLNFRFMPLNMQVLFSNCVALIWNSFLSFKSHTAIELP